MNNSRIQRQPFLQVFFKGRFPNITRKAKGRKVVVSCRWKGTVVGEAFVQRLRKGGGLQGSPKRCGLNPIPLFPFRIPLRVYILSPINLDNRSLFSYVLTL